MAKPGNLKFPSAVKSIVGSSPTQPTSYNKNIIEKEKNNAS